MTQLDRHTSPFPQRIASWEVCKLTPLGKFKYKHGVNKLIYV